MSGLTIGIEFLTGRCVAATVSDRDEPEWPPHFGRVFMAMAAACFETGEDDAEVSALKWLESLKTPPVLQASDASRRTAVSVYVPVNDKVTATKSLLQTVPGMTRSKQERAFPTAIPHDPVVRFVWNDAPDADAHITALNRVCSNVIRVGHSSSLVRAWAQDCVETSETPQWQPTDDASELSTRIVGEGEFERLKRACNAARIEQFGELAIRIESGTASEKKTAKAEFEEAFGQKYKAALRPPEPTPPVLGLWQGYTQAKSASDAAVIEPEYFDPELIILGKVNGRSLGLQDTLAATRQLRNAAMKQAATQPHPPGWLSGHQEDGSPIEGPHVAFLALPYVGGPYADGHLMGLALAVPRSRFVPPEDRGRELRHLLINDDGNAREIELLLGRLGVWSVQMEDSDTPRRSLQNRTWVKPSRCWASVTPVVLDRFPKKNRATDRKAWHAEVVETIALSCERAGMPRPIEIDVDTTSWHAGAPRAYRKSRRLSDGRQESPETAFGAGFPPMPSRAGKPARPQIHVFLKFAHRVRGPVLLGAGRFLGYGFCKPLETIPATVKRFPPR